VGRDPDAAFLEALGDGGDLVPGPEIALEVDVRDDPERFRLGAGAAVRPAAANIKRMSESFMFGRFLSRYPV